MNRKQRRAAAAANSAADFVKAFNAGFELHQAGRLEEALAAYDVALKLKPDHALLCNNVGVALYALRRVEQAIIFQKRAVAADPSMGMAYNNLGVSLNFLELHEDAIEAFTRAIALEPDNSRALNNLGDSYTKLGRYEESVPVLEKALRLDPVYVEAKSNLGMARWGLGDLDGAVALFRSALSLQPDHATVHKNLGLVLLIRGEYAEGWREAEWRLIADRTPMHGNSPLWDGRSTFPSGKLFVWAEHGVGDEVLYASMLQDLIERGHQVVWETDARLAPLIRRSFPAVQVVPRVFPPSGAPPIDDIRAQLAAGSLGQHLRPSVSSFPSARRSYLRADQERTAALRAALNVAPGEKLVGVSWASRNIAFGRHKSSELSDWAEILRTPGTRFVDLQYGDTAAERAAFSASASVALAHLDGLDLRNDLDGVAALVAACDLVVTVSNTTAHIAGALGVPVWVMVPKGGGKLWYWGVTGDTAPWYPTATLIRQVSRGDWAETLATAAQRLRQWVMQPPTF